MLSGKSRVKELELKKAAMLPYVEKEGPGGMEVFLAACQALEEGYRDGAYQLVTIEDLWSEALQEGRMLFKTPERLWGPTTAEETADMIGQTTVGPWQITTWNVRDNFGPKYGLPKGLSDRDVLIWCRQRPVIQARMIADYIQNAYSTYGLRGPFAIQSYFWLEPYVKGEIGQSKEWWKSPVAKPPVGKTWKDLTPEMIKDTGFYAKQVVCGYTWKSEGILFWLTVTNDVKAIDHLLQTWKNEVKHTWNPEKKIAEKTAVPGEFELKPEDLQFWPEGELERKQIVIERMNKLR